jgi:hypothetical protein
LQHRPTPELSKPTKEDLLNYQAYPPIFEQVTNLFGYLVTTINLYLLATGGLWAFALGSTDRPGLRMPVFVLHILISIAAAAVCWGLGSTIKQRLNFLNLLGEALWPSIEAIGLEASRSAGVWKIRQQLMIWTLIPVLGAVGTAGIGLMAYSDPATSALCAQRLRSVETASTEVELNRAIFLLTSARCHS